MRVKNLKVLRKAAGISGVEFAKMMKVSPITVYRWEVGERTPTAKHFQKISQILNVPMEDLVD